jgi:hypothetical protein
MNNYVEAGLPMSSVKGITMWLDPNACTRSGEGALALALHTLTSALRLLPPPHASAWTVASGECSPPLAFQVIPLPGQRVSTLETWNLIHLLREQPDVLTVEPAFGSNPKPLTAFV